MPVPSTSKRRGRPPKVRRIDAEIVTNTPPIEWREDVVGTLPPVTIAIPVVEVIEEDWEGNPIVDDAEHQVAEKDAAIAQSLEPKRATPEEIEQWMRNAERQQVMPATPTLPENTVALPVDVVEDDGNRIRLTTVEAMATYKGDSYRVVRVDQRGRGVGILLERLS